MQAYKELEAVFTKLYNFRHMKALAFWDSQVMMPPKGAAARAAGIAELDIHVHSLITDPRMSKLLAEAEEGEDALEFLQRVNLREMRMEWEREALLTKEMVERKAMLTSNAQQIWRKSREENDFSQFLPIFKELIKLFREVGKALAGNSGRSPYEALLNLYEPGFSLNRLDEIFTYLKSWLPALIRDVVQRSADEEAALEPKGPFPIEKQKELSQYCMNVWKFDMEAGRQDMSTHPFCGNVKEDVRITTKYDIAQFETGLMALIHETGHAKYEQNCGPQEMPTQPVSKARSLGIHEGQSLFAEKMIGRSGAFMEFIVPKLQELFGEQPALTPENIRRFTQRVKPGFIRIHADELCYPMHIILRYEIERALIEGTMDPEDVPTVWNEKMKTYLGVETTDNDSDGCLQDIHWSLGYIGYFATYSIGAMVAAQLMAAIRRDLGEAAVDDAIRKGELGAILEEQRERIWRQGSLWLTEHLLENATGEPLNPEHYRRHLERRYRDRLD